MMQKTGKKALKPLRSILLMLIITIVLIVIQFFIPPYYRFLLTVIFVYGIFAVGLDLLIGYTGLLSFGHALFFGIGAFFFAFFTKISGFWPSLAVGVIIATLTAAGVGAISIRTRGVYFAVLTFIFAYVAFYIALDPSMYYITGCSDGFNFTPPPVSFGIFEAQYNPVTLYYLALVLLLVSYFVCRTIVNSPLGRVMLAVRENETRARCLGYNTAVVKFAAFMFSGLFAGLSGSLFAYVYHYVNAHMLELSVSANAVVWVLLGGAGTLAGPLLGAGIVTLFTDYVMTHVGEYHLILLGILLIFVIVFLPRGIMGSIKVSRLWRRT